MQRVSGRTVAYAGVIALIVVAVAFLMSKVARTEGADRRLLTIAAVVAGALVLGGLSMLGMRRGRSGSAERGEADRR